MNRKGQALVEFVLILPIFIMILFSKEYPKVDIKLTNEEKYTIVEISTKVNIITPGLNRVLGNPYIVKVERKIPNVEDKQ